jgi:ribosomal 50S subunit-associated protein YjgA (DUF615 family)
MWTGRQTLSSIESAIAKLQGEESQLDQSLQSATAEAERLRKERNDALRELARVKLDEMAAGRLVDNLDAGERRALQILQDYQKRVAETARQRDQHLKDIERLEANRNTAAAAVETALAAVEELRAQAEAEVQGTPEWRDANTAYAQADGIASEAEKKAASSETELGAKKKPYDDDALFIYLWRRRYGTSEYRAGNLARYFDGITARFIAFSDARANYAALVEIPLRLREHATAKRAAAAGQKSTLSDIERRAMVKAGVDAKEKILADAREALAAVDAEAEEKRTLLRKIDEARTALVAGGTNPAYNEALSTISTADSTDDLTTLYREARRTQTSADEAIVRRLERIDGSIENADKEIAGLRRTSQDLARRRVEVEQVRDRFRNAGYDHPHTTFGNETDIADVLKGLVQGAIRSGVLWDLLRQGYGYRPPRGRPDFGAPTFPFPFPIPGGGGERSSGGGWREPTSRGSWSPRIDFPPMGGGSSDSRDDDDRFTTGGSF